MPGGSSSDATGPSGARLSVKADWLAIDEAATAGASCAILRGFGWVGTATVGFASSAINEGIGACAEMVEGKWSRICNGSRCVPGWM